MEVFLPASTRGRHRINAHRTHINIHASSGIRTHDLSVGAGEDSSCLRPRGHCDRHTDSWVKNIFDRFLCANSLTLSWKVKLVTRETIISDAENGLAYRTGNDRTLLIRCILSVALGELQWPRGLRHELSSPAQTLKSSFRIPLEAWMFMCINSVFMLRCAWYRPWDRLIHFQGLLPTVY
jgi:hypothetical protein